MGYCAIYLLTQSFAVSKWRIVVLLFSCYVHVTYYYCSENKTENLQTMHFFVFLQNARLEICWCLSVEATKLQKKQIYLNMETHSCQEAQCRPTTRI